MIALLFQNLVIRWREWRSRKQIVIGDDLLSAISKLQRTAVSEWKRRDG